MAGVNKEIWLNILMELFYSDHSCMEVVVDVAELEDVNTLNHAESGVDPDVLEDNAVWAIPVVQRDDNDTTIPLSTYDSKNTVVRNVEEMEAAYDKMQSVIRQHQKAIMQRVLKSAAQNWAP